MTTELVTTTVNVPAERLGEFYEMFGKWLNGVDRPEPEGWRDGRAWGESDFAQAETFYRSVSANARLVLDFWAANPGRWVSGDETAREVGVNGPKGVAGTLSSVGKTADKMKRQLPFEHRDGQSGESGMYRMSHEISSLFVAAKRSVR